jgi:hypothetical protein
MFMDVFVGLFGSMNDSWVLQRSFLYKHAQYKILLDVDKGINNGPFLPYLLDDKDPNIHSFHGSSPFEGARSPFYSWTPLKHKAQVGTLIVEMFIDLWIRPSILFWEIWIECDVHTQHVYLCLHYE